MGSHGGYPAEPWILEIIGCYWQALQHITPFSRPLKIILYTFSAKIRFVYHIPESPRVSESPSPTSPTPTSPSPTNVSESYVLTSPSPRVPRPTFPSPTSPSPTSPSPTFPSSTSSVPRRSPHVPVPLLVTALQNLSCNKQAQPIIFLFFLLFKSIKLIYTHMTFLYLLHGLSDNLVHDTFV